MNFGPGNFWQYLLIYDDGDDSDAPAPPGCAKGCLTLLGVAAVVLILLVAGALFRQ